MNRISMGMLMMIRKSYLFVAVHRAIGSTIIFPIDNEFKGIAERREMQRTMRGAGSRDDIEHAGDVERRPQYSLWEWKGIDT